MRTVTYGGACSLDGFIAGPDGALDWLHFSRDVEEVTATYWKDVDTILMGRKTWDISVAMADAGESPPLDPGAIHSYVFSRTLERI